ncbi:hypothetical protein BDF14DRAFT_1795704 [Spinellus fusiger]|nr:hypothetical protein BDF14DRAFT_1795704 [Spinellus fusiger]
MTPHPLKNCPLRSMAWLNVHQGIVAYASQEWKSMVGYDPTHLPLCTVWQEIQPTHVTLLHPTTQTLLHLHLCFHPTDLTTTTIVCSNVTSLYQLATVYPLLSSHGSYGSHGLYDSYGSHGSYESYGSYDSYDSYESSVYTTPPTMTILRLTCYGTIEAQYDPTTHYHASVGIPLMRYVHCDDLQSLCGHLSAAQHTAQHTATPMAFITPIPVSPTAATFITTPHSFSIRCDFDHRTGSQYDWFHFTVLQVADEFLCIIRPAAIARDSSPCNTPAFTPPLVGSLCHVFWQCLETRVTQVAHGLASVLMATVENVMAVGRKTETEKESSLLWKEKTVYGLVKEIKGRPEMEAVWKAAVWTGLVKKSTQQAFEQCLDQGAAWLVTKSQAERVYDATV